MEELVSFSQDLHGKSQTVQGDAVAAGQNKIIFEGSMNIGAPNDKGYSENFSEFHFQNANELDSYSVSCAREVTREERKMFAKFLARKNRKKKDATDKTNSGGEKNNKDDTILEKNTDDIAQNTLKRNEVLKLQIEKTATSLKVGYNCRASGTYKCELRPRWAVSKEQFENSLRWTKTCGGNRGVHVRSRDATMVGELPILTSVDAVLRAAGEVRFFCTK